MELKERLDKIKEIVETDSFFNQQSLGGELNFHIFDYNPEDELVVRDYVKDFLKSYSHTNSKIKPVEFDLFEMIIEILQNKKVGSKNILDMSFIVEDEEGTEELFDSLNPILTPSAFIELIKERVEGHNLVLLTGIGKAYPLVRSHTILNNLHSVLDKIPVIMFYPGRYDQKDLKLFNNGSSFTGLKDDNYYRAFKLVEN